MVPTTGEGPSIVDGAALDVCSAVSGRHWIHLDATDSAGRKSGPDDSNQHTQYPQKGTNLVL